MVFKDQKLQKIGPITNGLMKGSVLLGGSSSESEESPKEDENAPNEMFQEDDRVGAKLDNDFLERNENRVCVSVPQQKREKKRAVRAGWAAFSSMYVCTMLLGLLLSGFVFGGLVKQRLVEKPVQIKETLNFVYTMASPVALVPLSSSSSIHASSGLFDTYNMPGSARVIPYRHNLQITVSMTVPESDYNRKLGVFQVKVELLSANGEVTASSSYPSMLKFKSKPIRYAETLLKSAPLIAGFGTESQVLSVTMNDFTEGLEPTTCLKVTTEQRAEYEHVGGVPQTYDASLALESELPQLKKLIWEWKMTIFVWISIMVFLTEFIVIMVFFRSIIVPWGSKTRVTAESIPFHTL
ncbi:hypothetical protein L6164_018310 [Bauhinia variegata]|uniref:Uncharacterized protein n=1 Tax=Bauhinia variegata TaxID=167791 RepID=A0ACB9NBB5_BAUVA|nr:hypothetical protein L6164_018310 [Bauhinia variegata]